MWTQLLEKSGQKHKTGVASDDKAIREAEKELGVSFPPELSGCLKECGEVHGSYSEALVWPVARIISDNISFRKNSDFKDLYMPFDCLLFFGDAGNGDQFAYPIQNKKIHRQDVFVWSHEDDSRKSLAPSLAKFLEWWFAGKIEI
jgi:hypothetical protein